ncbi:MAG: ECF transporter S component [Clostridia bacterium]|nr:ECF transporter S component [Clostridia bacterium]
MRRSRNQKILYMVELAMLTALVVVLQIFGGFFKIGPFSLSLVLIPVVIGSVVLGAKGGAILGAVFGLVVVIQCAMGIDAGGAILMSINPFLTVLICMVKGTAAGFVPGIVYHAIVGKKQESNVRMVTGAVIAAVSAPIVNTGLFVIGLSAFFNSTLVEWAGGANVMLYIITGLVGINFLIEFFINVVVSPAISTIIKVTTKQLAK